MRGLQEEKFPRKCFNCGKKGHKSSSCRLPKRNKPKEANAVDDISKDVSDIDLTIVISEVNLVGSNPKEWWIDISATTMYAWTRRCSAPLNQLRLGKSC